MMVRYPTGTTCCIYQGIENRPVGDGITAVFHGFCLAVGRCYGTGIQMVAANNDRGFYFACPYEFIKKQSGFFTFAHTQPADTCGQALESDALSCHMQPAV